MMYFLLLSLNSICGHDLLKLNTFLLKYFHFIRISFATILTSVRM